MLLSVHNLVYLRRSADVIGALVARTDARRVSHASKLSNETERGDDSSEDIVNGTKGEDESKKSLKDDFMKSIRLWIHKCLGGDGSVTIPPVGNWNQAAWTFLGAFGGLILLAYLDHLLRRSTDDEYFLIMGPIGALATLQYGLTPAPASQPRNAVLGQILAGIVVIPFTYIPSTFLPVWVRSALATAIAIAAMVKLGVVHPPAGGAAVVLSTGKLGWEFCGLMVLASIISVLPAMALNNMCSKRQYPIYWGYIVRHFKMRASKKQFSG